VLGPFEREMVLRALESNFPNDGEFTEAFEREVAAICGTRFAVGVTSGTAALFLAVAACDIGVGDEVIVPDLTFIATANAVRLAGANVVLVDVCRDNMTINPAEVERAITSRTRAIVPVHVNGRSAGMKELGSIASRNGLRIIEDAAGAFGVRVEGKALGSIGDLGCFSFAPSKIITTGQGGAVVTNEERLYWRLRELKDQGRPVRGTGGADEHHSLGFNFKLSNILAAVGLAQLRDLERRRDHLKSLYEWYRDGLSELNAIEVPAFRIERGEAPQWIDVLVKDRDGLADFLARIEIETRKFWYPLHTQAPYRLDGAKFPNSGYLSQHGLWLPSALSVSQADVLEVCSAIADFVGAGLPSDAHHRL